MAKYKLLAQHFSEEDKLLEADTEVGAGTPHAWTRPPTVEMEGLDEEGKKAVAKEHIRAGEGGAPGGSPIDGLPMTIGPANDVRR